MLGFTCQWVSFPLRDITRKQRRFFAEPPALHFAPSSGFHSLSTVCSALELAGLFHPAATSRVIFRSGASLPPQPPFLIGRSFPPCHCCIAAPTHGPTFAGSPVSPRAMPLSFEASICARPRSSGPVIHLARSRSPLRISRSSRFSLSRRRQPLSRSPSAHDVTRSVLRKNSLPSFDFYNSRSNCEEPNLQARPGKTRRRSSCCTPFTRSSYDNRAGGRSLAVIRTFRCVDQGAESRAFAHGVAASCILRCGSLEAVILSHPPLNPFGLLEGAHDLFPPCDVPRSLDGPCSPCGAHVRARLPAPPLRMAPAYEARDCASSLKDGHVRARLSTLTACSPSRCLRPRSSCDVRVHIRVGVLLSSVHVFAQTSLRSLPFAFTTKSSWSRSPSGVCRARLSTITGNTPSAHSPRARELVSRFDENKRRSSSF